MQLKSTPSIKLLIKSFTGKMSAYSSFCSEYSFTFLVFSTVSLTCADYVSNSGADGLLEEELCFEIPPWHQKPVEVDEHLYRIKSEFGNASVKRRQIESPKVAFNSEVNRYVDAVIIPFLDTYHTNIQNSIQQLRNKITRKCKEDMNTAIAKKLKLNNNLTHLADSLNIPVYCAEERRAIRTLSSKHVALVHKCTEQARMSISKMERYVDDTISITSSHMENALVDAARKIQNDRSQNVNVTECLKELSRAAVSLGYELDLGLTNARRHNQQVSEKLAQCLNRAKRSSDEEVQKLREYLYQCVYA